MSDNEFVEFTRPSGKKLSIRKSEIATFENKMIGLKRSHFFEYDVKETYEEIKELLSK